MIDDGSKDNSSKICREFAQKDCRFKYVYQENAGVSSARNKGLDLATGDYIGFCDSDDWVESDMYESLYGLIKETQADISVVSPIRSDDEVVKDDLDIKEFDSHGAIIEMHKGFLFAGHLWNKLIKRELFDGVRLDKNIAILEDMLVMWELFFKADKVVFQDVHKYHYIYNPQSAMRSKFKASYWSIREAGRKMLDNMSKYYPEDVVYAHRTIVSGDYQLAERLAISGNLTKENYQIIKSDFDNYYNEEIKELLSEKIRRKVDMLLKGRTLFVMYMTVIKVYREIKLLLWQRSSRRKD